MDEVAIGELRARKLANYDGACSTARIRGPIILAMCTHEEPLCCSCSIGLCATACAACAHTYDVTEARSGRVYWDVSNLGYNSIIYAVV